MSTQRLVDRGNAHATSFGVSGLMGNCGRCLRIFQHWDRWRNWVGWERRQLGQHWEGWRSRRCSGWKHRSVGQRTLLVYCHFVVVLHAAPDSLNGFDVERGAADVYDDRERHERNGLRNDRYRRVLFTEPKRSQPRRAVLLQRRHDECGSDDLHEPAHVVGHDVTSPTFG
jgi:hypothetical protein